MAPTPLAWLLRLAALCHLTVLLAGQHLGVTKCNITCNQMTSRIPVALLIHYRHNQESCGKRAIILETIRHKLFCADPKEKWVQEAMEHLNRRAAAATQNGGIFEKQIGPVKPTTTPVTAVGQSHPTLSEPQATAGSRSLEMTASSQEPQRPMGTSPELPVGTTESSGPRSPPTSKAQEKEPPAGPESSQGFTVAWRSKPGPDLWAEGKAPESPSTQVLSTEPPSTQTPSIPYLAPEENTGSEGKPMGVRGQSPSPKTSPGPEEMGPAPGHTDAFQDWGRGSMAHTSVAPVSSEGTPSREPVGSGSWAPKTEEPIHATVDPQRLGVLITPVPDTQAATRRQAVGLLAFLGLLFCLGVAMFAYQSLQGCPRKMAGEMVEGLRYVPRSCGSNSYVLVPV